MHQITFFSALKNSFRHIFKDQGVLLLLIGAPILYSFFYPWFYAPQVVERVPVAIVVEGQSALTREIIRYASASPRLDVRIITGNEDEAISHLRKGNIYGYAYLRHDLKRRILYGQDLAIPVYAHGGYPVLSKQVQYGFTEALQTINTGIHISHMNALGQSALEARAGSIPLSLQTISLFNPTDGYATFVVPAVAFLILQQTLMLGSAVYFATIRENFQDRSPLTNRLKLWLARLLAPTIIGWVMTLYYFGWVFVIHGYPAGGNLIGSLVLAGIYAPSVIGIGALTGWWTANRERNLQIIIFTSLAFAFVGGFSWPAEALPAELQFIRWLVPCTAGMQAGLRLNQFAAPLNTVLPELLVLPSIFIISWIFFLYLVTPKAYQKIVPERQ